MKRKHAHRYPMHPIVSRRMAGFSLMEVLVALLVLAIGLLGLAGLQAAALRFNHDALLRSQATLLAYDMADRMRANRTAALNGNYNEDFANPAPACNNNFVPGGGTVAQQDWAEWSNLLACYLPQGNGRVQINGNVATIIVRWDEERDGVADNLQTFQFQTRLQ